MSFHCFVTCLRRNYTSYFIRSDEPGRIKQYRDHLGFQKPQNLSDAAASVFIITSEDIRRSGVSTLPEALRLAPNLHVAQVSASGYAISARGLNGSGNAPNKLLILIDGRSVYSPLFSGIFWD